MNSQRKGKEICRGKLIFFKGSIMKELDLQIKK